MEMIVLKKILCAILAGVLIIMASSCQKNAPPVDESIKNAPEHISGLFNALNKLALEHKFDFRASNYAESTFAETVMRNFNFQYKGEGDKDVPLLSFNFWQGSDLNFSSIGIFKEDEEKRPEYFKDIVTAIIMYIEPDLSLEAAVSKTQGLFDSRPSATTDTRYSDILEIGGYKMWFETGRNSALTATRFSDSFHVRKTDKMSQEHLINNNQFTLLTKDNAEFASIAIDMYMFTGKVNDFILTDWDYLSSCEVEDAEGQKAVITYDYGSCPVVFEIGKTYTFYGASSDLAVDDTTAEGREWSVGCPFISMIAWS